MGGGGQRKVRQKKMLIFQKLKRGHITLTLYKSYKTMIYLDRSHLEVTKEKMFTRSNKKILSASLDDLAYQHKGRSLSVKQCRKLDLFQNGNGLSLKTWQFSFKVNVLRMGLLHCSLIMNLL